MKGFISKYCRTNLILLDIKADWKGSISMWCECDLSGQLKPSKRANIIRMVNYVFQTILYYFVFCFIASLFFLNVYASIYVTPFLFTSVFVSFLFISFVLTLFHACLLPSFTFLSFTISFFSCFFFQALSQSTVRNRLSISWCISICLSVQIILSPNGRIYVKFNIGNFL